MQNDTLARSRAKAANQRCASVRRFQKDSLRAIVLLFLVGAVVDAHAADKPPKPPADDSAIFGETGKVPPGAKITLELDKPGFFLGENILANYVIENTGQEAIRFSRGGDSWAASRETRFKVTATDADGNLVRDPDPSPFCLGGLMGGDEIRPGGKYSFCVPLVRFCRFEKPGVYTIRAFHDLGWGKETDHDVRWAAAKLTARLPTPEQARQVLEEMERLAASKTQVNKRGHYADFSALRHPVYLPLLTERAEKGSDDALVGISSVFTTEATATLIRLLDAAKPPMAGKIACYLNYRLPDPELEGKIGPRGPFVFVHSPTHQWVVQQSWRAEFAPAVRRHACTLLETEDKASMKYGAFMLQCVGGKEEFPVLLRALDKAIAETKTTPAETGCYPPPHGSCQELLRATQVMMQRGIEPPVEPKSPGECVLFLLAVGNRKDFRPTGWEERCRLLWQHEIPYVRKLALDNTPRPLSEAAIKLLPALMMDGDPEVKIAAFGQAEKTGTPNLREPLLKAFRAALENPSQNKSAEFFVRNGAANAADTLGVSFEAAEIWLPYIENPSLSREALEFLLRLTTTGHISSSSGTLDAASLKALREGWSAFLKQHRDELKAGRRFAPGDGSMPASLVPSNSKWTQLSLTPDMLESMKKQVSPEQFEQVLEAVKKKFGPQAVESLKKKP